jgi:nicotinamidase-related amidase
MLTIENTVLVIIDIQDKLFRAMYEKDRLLDNTRKLIEGCDVLDIPMLLTEQYPKGLGRTVPEIRQLIPEISPIEKLSFSCWGDSGFYRALTGLGRKQVLLAGIEAHVCVYQTAADLAGAGYETQVVADCVSSRTRENRGISLQRIGDTGASITTMEMALFELLKTADNEKFRTISNIVK